MQNTFKQFRAAYIKHTFNANPHLNLIQAMRYYKINTAALPSLAVFLEEDAARTRIVFHSMFNAVLLKQCKLIAHLF